MIKICNEELLENLAIPKTELHVNRDCFGGFVSVKHAPCRDTRTTPNIIDEAGQDQYGRGLGGRYICEKCRREASRDVWASLFKKRIPLP